MSCSLKKMSTNQPFQVLATLALAILHLLVAQQLRHHQVDCFSTPSFGAHLAGPASSGRYLSSLAHANSNQHQDESSEYTNNYIMAIEDQSTRPAGFMVSTTDHNYAIQSPRLAELEWLSLTVNGAQVFILTKENRTLSASLFTLSESERDFIAEMRAKFTQNLAGLKFAYYTSGSTLALSGGGGGGGGGAYREPVRYSAPSGGGQHGYYPAATAAAVATAPLAGYEHQTVASGAISQLNDANYLANLQEQRRRGIARGLPEPMGGVASGPGDVRYSLSGPLSDPGKRIIGKRYLVDAAGASAAAAVAANGGYFSLPARKRAKAAKGARGKQQVVARHSGGSYRLVDEREGPAHLAGAGTKTKTFSKCSFQNLVNFNYYNLDQRAELNGTLAGDIYYFDFHCNILDVYSSSVSVRRQPDASVLYRDHRYFSYSRSQLPLEINRLFLISDQVFFVYNDGSLLLKQGWLLDPAELDLVLGVRQELKNVSEWQSRAAGLTSKGGASTTPAPESQATTEMTTTTTTSEPPPASAES